MHDQYNDKSLAVLKKLSTIIELPGFVKQASVVDEKELNSLPRTAFGDPVNRKYPLATKKDTYLSALYFRKYASEYEDSEYAKSVKDNIDKALVLWKIPHTFVKKAQHIEKKAGITEVIHIRDMKGNNIDDWELNSPRDFEKAAIQLFENKGMFSFEQRKDIARQLINSDLKKEASLKDDVDTYLDKAAGFGMCTKLQLVDAIRKRSYLYKEADERFAEVLAEYALALEDQELDCSHLEKTASVMDFLDKHTDIYKKYADLPSPEESLFIYTEKTAQELKDGYVKLQNGSNIEKTAIEEEKLNSFFDNFLGEIPKVSLEEKLDILSSLPVPDADDFETYYMK